MSADQTKNRRKKRKQIYITIKTDTKSMGQVTGDRVIDDIYFFFPQKYFIKSQETS